MQLCSPWEIHTPSQCISLIEDNMQQIERMRSDAARAASLLGSLTPPEGSVA